MVEMQELLFHKGGVMKPVYAENIVVAIRYDGFVEWYILDKDYCFGLYKAGGRVS